jgi:hypothetical protein
MNNIEALHRLETEINAIDPLGSIRKLSDIEAGKIEWLWSNRIPIGEITILEGDGGKGKSSLVAFLAAALSQGRALPDDVSRPPINVLMFAAEDDPSIVIRPRFERADADLRIFEMPPAQCFKSIATTKPCRWL